MWDTLRTFDVFDTLIARRCVGPVEVLQKLELRSRIPGLAQARLAADQRLGSLGRPYDLLAIWQEVAKRLRLSDATVMWLLHLEVQIEHEEIVPIGDNLALVRDGDLLISDTYLPAEVVLSLLRKAGLQRTVGLVVSNDGKYRGWIWPQVLQKVAIAERWGDNEHSDGRTPSQAGIKAIIYKGAKRTPVEQFLCEPDYTPLANLIREVRLANAIPNSRPREKQLWNLSCQLNFPLLFFASLALERYAHEHDIREIFFLKASGRNERRTCKNAGFRHYFPTLLAAIACFGISFISTSSRIAGQRTFSPRAAAFSSHRTATSTMSARLGTNAA